MSTKPKQRVLAIFAHSDDELSTAGTLANHAERGDEVTLAFLTKGENSTTVQGDKEDTIRKRREHTKKIENLLGIKIRFLEFTDSKIDYSVESAYKVSELIRELRPNIIITWNEYLRMGAGHPDHRNTSKLVWDAVNYARYHNPDSEFEPYREPVNFYRYYNPQSSDHHDMQLVDVSEQEDKIKKFIEIYQEAYGDWPVLDFKFNSLRFYGGIGNCKLAEVFEVLTKNTKAPKYLD